MSVAGLRFSKPSVALAAPTPHLYVANCGPALNLTVSQITEAFEEHGRVAGVSVADDSGTRVIVSFERAEDAAAARGAWNGKPCMPLLGLVMFIDYALPRKTEMAKQSEPVFFCSLDMEIPGIILHSEFVSPAEEKELLAAVDERPWQTLAKRKVQHYGYEFLYKVRNVDLTKKLGELPTFVDHVVERMSALPEVANSTEKSLPFDQLTVNEYPRGVGLSPHIDTHSAFEGSILSLSLAGACVMEFRKYHKHSYDLHTSKANYDSRVHGTHIMGRGLDCEARQTIPDLHQTTYFSEQEMIEPPKVKVERRVLYLPQRSLLILSNEARYGWHHYIPHHKEDVVNGEKVPRSSRRVSFTFRKVRLGPCYCQFPHLCDSQAEIAEVPVSIINAWGSKDNDSTVLGREYTICSAVEDNAVHDKIHGVSLTVSEVKDATTCKVWIPATPEIEKMYVQEVYDAIAPHFSSTRFAKWPKVAQFLHSIAPGSIVVDAGCGNGKYLGLNPKCFFVGCDISAPLVAICAQRGHEVLIADALFLPYRTGVCDAAISIAVLHHLSSEQRRVRAIEELLRVVRHGGKVLITVWAVEQEDKSLLTKWTPLTGKYMEEWVGSSSHKAKGNLSENSLHMIQEGDTLEDKSADEEQEFVTIFSQKFDGQEDSRQMKEQQEYFVPWHLPYHRAEIGGASAAAVARGFARKDDKKGAVVYNRYYHVFVEGELERLISKCAGASVVDQFYDKSNWDFKQAVCQWVCAASTRVWYGNSFEFGDLNEVSYVPEPVKQEVTLNKVGRVGCTK